MLQVQPPWMELRSRSSRTMDSLYITPEPPGELHCSRICRRTQHETLTLEGTYRFAHEPPLRATTIREQHRSPAAVQLATIAAYVMQQQLSLEREYLLRVSLPLHSQRDRLVKSCQTLQIMVNAGEIVKLEG